MSIGSLVTVRPYITLSDGRRFVVGYYDGRNGPRARHLHRRGREAPLHAVAEVRVLAEGLAGDRYARGVGAFSRWLGSGRAVTLIAREAIDGILRDTGIDLTAGQSRRNIVTEGVELAELNGQLFRIGTALLRGARLCAPCAYLERLAGPGSFDALKGRGGLRADVVEPGVIRAGDAIESVRR